MTPFAVFFLRQFFLGVNREVEEAALMDGADVPTVFFKVVLPMTVPAITTLAVITFISSWNNYMWPLIVGNKETVRVLTVALGVFRSQTPQGAPDWTGLMAPPRWRSSLRSCSSSLRDARSWTRSSSQASNKARPSCQLSEKLATGGHNRRC
jgi:hypothetical protein